MTDIQAYVGQIARRFSPERIILFGSYVRDEPTEDSDVDLLLVMPDDGDPIGNACEIRREIDNRFPLDLIVRDPDVLRWRIENEDWFLREAMEQGRVLYETNPREQSRLL